MKNSPSRLFFCFLGDYMLCLCDERTPRDVIDALNRLGFEVTPLPLCDSLPEPVCGHTDLIVFPDDRFLTVSRGYYKKNAELIDGICKKSNLTLRFSTREAGDKYPYDCLLCAAVSGDRLLYCSKSTDHSITDRFRLLVDLPQGYVKCSCAMLGDGAIITADKGISTQTTAAGIDTLLISAGHVELPGYGYGFIGGASGLCGDKLYFCGNLDLHPDSEAIKAFAKKHGTECISLSDRKLYDVGSLIFI